jgi:hypothetical protein
MYGDPQVEDANSLNLEEEPSKSKREESACALLHADRCLTHRQTQTGGKLTEAKVTPSKAARNREFIRLAR